MVKVKIILICKREYERCNYCLIINIDCFFLISRKKIAV